MKKTDNNKYKNYINNHSQPEKKNYKHKFINKRINNNYDKIYCILVQ